MTDYNSIGNFVYCKGNGYAKFVFEKTVRSRRFNARKTMESAFIIRRGDFGMVRIILARHNAQNYGKGDYGNVKKGTLQALIIMLIIYVICLISGLLLSINGAYQYVFMSKDKISAQSIAFGNAYVIVDFALYFILGFLIVIRSAVQGICKSAFVLGAGIAELVARILTCSFLPILINGGAINAIASPLSFYALCLGDPMAWTLASTVLLFPLVKNIIKKRY